MSQRQSATTCLALLSAGLTATCLVLALKPEPRAQAQSLLAPIPRKEFKARLPVYDQTTLPNGLTVYSYQDDTLPVVAVGLAVRTGGAAEPAEKAGLAQLAYRLLAARANSSQGSDGRPNTAELGTHLSWDVDPDGGRLQLNVLASQAERAVALLAGLVQQPAAAASDFQRVKSELFAIQQAEHSLPRVLAEEQLRPLIYGAQHPYGHLPVGNAATLSAIMQADIATYYGCLFHPKNVALILTGHVSESDARTWAMRHLGSWQDSGPTCEQPAALPTAAKRTQVVAVPRRGLAQTLILVGRAVVPIGHNDELALRLADSYLKARAFRELRLKKGITYGVSGELVQKPQGGQFSLSTQVQADQTGEAVSELLSQMFGVRYDSVPVRFVISARVGLGWSTVSEYATLSSSVRHVAQLFRWRQPLTWDQARLMRLQQVGPLDVDAAASRYFDRSVMQIVLVGDREIIKTQVGALNLGTLRFTEDCRQSGDCD